MLRSAAEAGHAGGMTVLGAMYLLGRGVPQTPELAEQWMRRGAEAGNIDAQATLGMMYATGKGTPKDLSKAQHWLHMAAENGEEQSVEMLEILTQQGLLPVAKN